MEIYILASLLWAIYAGKKQIQRHGVRRHWRLLLCVLLNGLFWPIGIFIAVLNPKA